MSSAESSDEREAFEVTDYDIEAELNPFGRRRKQTKDDMIYGVFNDDFSGTMKVAAWCCSSMLNSVDYRR